jgi:hypothetical protein
MYGIEGVFPVNDEKRRGLLVQEKILAYETPEGEWLGIRRRWLRGTVAKCLDVADRLSLNSQQALEGRTRIHAAVVIDGENALPQMERWLCMQA